MVKSLRDLWRLLVLALAPPEAEERAIVGADDFRFRQIVRNLVSNARRYGAAPIGVRGLVVNGAYQLTVYDHGQGRAEAPPELLAG